MTAEDGYKITYYAPQPRAAIEVVSFDDDNRVVGYGETGQVRLTTLTRETFIPGFWKGTKASVSPPVNPIRGTASAGSGHSASSPPRQPWEFTERLLGAEQPC